MQEGGGGRPRTPGPANDGHQPPEGTAARPGTRHTLPPVEEFELKTTEMLNCLPSTIMEIAKMPPPCRPGFGGWGKPIKIRTNHFPVECNLTNAYHYDVDITSSRRPRTPDRPDTPPPSPGGSSRMGQIRPIISTPACRAVIRQLSEDQHWPAGIVFDGRKNLFMVSKYLPMGPETHTVRVVDDETARVKMYCVKIKWVTVVGIADLLDFVGGASPSAVPQDALQTLEIALKHGAQNHPLCTNVQRGLYFQDDQMVHLLSGGAEIWTGYQQSLRPCLDRLTLNVNLTSTAFLQEMPVPRFLAKAAGLNHEDELAHADESQKKRALKAILGVKVTVRHLGLRPKTYKVKGMTAQGAAQLEFIEMNTNKPTNVAQYFEERYGMRLLMPYGPCLNVGTPKRPIHMPVEVCTIAPAQRKLKLDERQTSEMIKSSSQGPQERAFMIERAVNELGCLPTDPHVRAFGMAVDRSMMTVEGRILEPPELLYNRPLAPGSSGQWELSNRTLHRPAALPSYGIASFVPSNRCGDPANPTSLPVFMFELMNAISDAGITVSRMDSLPDIAYHCVGVQSYPGETLQEAAEHGAVHFGDAPRIIFVLLPDNGKDLYQEVKRASDSFLGIPSQCFVARKACIGQCKPSRSRHEYCASVALKVNAKLDGINCALGTVQPFMTKPFMVMGMSLSHPAGFDENEPSVAAVVGSMDAKCSRYSAEVQLQAHRVEIIQDLKTIMKRVLLNFYRATSGKKPEKLLLYRDGVSEGSFREVQQAEIPQILQACRELSEDYAPPLTFIVCQKRHHTRFFPTDGHTDPTGNCLPGTVLDHGITHPTEHDFFLLSHAGVRGTSRPTHYHVLLDQSQFSADELQLFTYHLTYTFCRCTRSVSTCPPAFYASLAATRGRAMLTQRYDTDTENPGRSRMNRSVGLDRLDAEFARIHTNVKTRMFYV